MRIADVWLAEFDHEMATTRKVLERLPDDNWDYKPHPKSMSQKQLAVHLANIPSWAKMIMGQDELDMSGPYTPPTAENLAELLAKFDAWRDEAREVVAAVEDEALLRDWTLKAGGQEVLRMPKLAVMRSFVFNHNVHHRAQLAVYLRLNDLPVPAIYGPSADEQG